MVNKEGDYDILYGTKKPFHSTPEYFDGEDKLNSPAAFQCTSLASVPLLIAATTYALLFFTDP